MAKSKQSASVSDFSTAAKTAEFQRAVGDLEQLCGSRRRPMNDVPGGFALNLTPGKAKSFKLEKVHTDFLRRGCYVFNSDVNDTKRLAILPTADKYAVISAMETGGPNLDISTADVIKWLRKLERAQPFIVTAVSAEHLCGKFTTKIKQPAELAMEIFEFAPELDNFDELEDELRKTGEFTLWWD